jgi:hypothetical protein
MGRKLFNEFVRIGTNSNRRNKINKFALLDDDEKEGYQPSNKLTHKGTDIDKIKYFNDTHFDNDGLDDNSADFD